jgi:hypothetical protein
MQDRMLVYCTRYYSHYITAAFKLHHATLLPNRVAMSIWYINNFHTSKYSERTEWFARTKGARYRLAKCVHQLVTVALNISNYRVFNNNTNLKVPLY